MEYSKFCKLAEKEINRIYDILQESGFDGDFDLINNILHIYTDQGEYIINQHSPSKQIWLSSPVSNAGYFSFNEDKSAWIDKNTQTLEARLVNDLGLKNY